MENNRRFQKEKTFPKCQLNENCNLLEGLLRGIFKAILPEKWYEKIHLCLAQNLKITEQTNLSWN